MREINPERMRKLEHMAREIGNVIGGTIEKQTGKKTGFALLVFDFEGPEFTWISNAQRADMVKVMQEFIERNPPDQTSEERN